MLKKIIAFFLRKRIVLHVVEDDGIPDYNCISIVVEYIMTGKIPNAGEQS